ncbi:peptide ABC transporter substrate-binding protein [Angelakisella massiliensis]|uniref:peptide ABC transporter substrate-binding protein n=1 Tax=Angelakisella massiliensis TaxID=1871018 RepID=UPI0023A7B3D0|nr:peptide ABC transporter substrate-binding protein [Angelakisella massiliensis]
MKKLALLLAAMMLVVSVAGCGSNTSASSSSQAAGESGAESSAAQNTAAVSPVTSWDGKELSVVVGPDPDTIDPALNSTVDGAIMIIHAFEGLCTMDEDGIPQPAQAESYTVSEDGLTYTFTLRDGLKWSDGTPLTAEDFAYSWQRAIDPATAADYSYMFECIDGYADGKLNVTAVDEKTLEVKLIAPTAYFLELTAFPTYMPVQKAAVEANGEQWALSAETYIGNGPYKISEWQRGSHITMVQNENYWNVEALGPESIRFNLVEDDVAQLSAYKTGEALFVDIVPNDEIDALKDMDDYYVMDQIGTYYVSFNVQKAPLDNPKVRQALCLAIDRDWICTNIGKTGQAPAGGFVPYALSDADPTQSFREVGGNYYDPSFEAYEDNLAKAKEILAEAGYPNGEGLPTIEYIYNEGTGNQQIGEALQNMWGELGVKVELFSQEWATFLNTRKNGEYSVARNAWLGDYNDPVSFLDMWITGGGNNDAQWSNPEYDALITEIKSTGDQAVRMEKMHQAEDMLFEEWIMAPIYFYTDYYLQSPAVENVWASPLGFKYFMYATPKAA